MKWIPAASLALVAAQSMAGQAVPSIALGMRIRVHTTTTEGTRSPPVDGILEHLYPDSLMLRPKSGELQTIPTNRETRYFVHSGRKSSLLKGGVIGTLTGVVAGAAVFAVAGGRTCANGLSVCAFPERTSVKGGMIFGVIGAATGLTVGAFSSHDIWRESDKDPLFSLVAVGSGLGLAIRF